MQLNPWSMKVDPNVVPSLTSGWFEDEYPNGQYWGFMDFINNFEMPPEDDM